MKSSRTRQKSDRGTSLREERNVTEFPDGSADNQDSPLSEYTYEDYIKDFESDYLGFDGVPERPAAGDSGKDDH